MKSLFLSALLTSAMLSAAAADSPSIITGNWNVHNSIAGNESDMACTLTQKDKDLTGSCKSDQTTGNLTGKIDDKKINWTYKSEYNGSPITLTYTGNREAADKIIGTVTVEEYAVDGEFTATVSK